MQFRQAILPVDFLKYFQDEFETEAGHQGTAHSEPAESNTNKQNGANNVVTFALHRFSTSGSKRTNYGTGHAR